MSALDRMTIADWEASRSTATALEDVQEAIANISALDDDLSIEIRTPEGATTQSLAIALDYLHDAEAKLERAEWKTYGSG